MQCTGHKRKDGHLPHSISSSGEFSCHYAVPTNCIEEEALRLLNNYTKQDSRHAKYFTSSRPVTRGMIVC